MPCCQAQTEHHGDSAHSHRWTSLELVKGTYSTDDSPSDIAEIRLDKAVPLKVCLPPLPPYPRLPSANPPDDLTGAYFWPPFPTGEREVRRAPA